MLCKDTVRNSLDMVSHQSLHCLLGCKQSKSGTEMYVIFESCKPRIFDFEVVDQMKFRGVACLNFNVCTCGNLVGALMQKREHLQIA